MEVIGHVEAVEMSSREPTSRKHALRRTKEKLKRDWVKEWHSRPLGGSFDPANRFPPSLSPTERFRQTPREVFGRLIQCRTGHGYIGEYYSRFVPAEDVDCPCGETFQTREHLLRECPLYGGQRHLLTKVSRDISLPEILGTKDGVKALSEFLKKTGAFTKSGRPREAWRLPAPDDNPGDDPEPDLEEEESDYG
jgi:hypothetical protein